MRLPIFAVAAALLSCSLAAHADLLGKTVAVTYDYPDAGTTYIDFGSQVVPTAGSVPYVGSYAVTATQISISSATDQQFPASAFNGFEFKVVGSDPMISGVTLDALSTFNQAAVSFTNDSVFINLAGTSIGTGQVATFDLTFGQPVTVAATPEPSSIALMGSGLLGVAGMVRRRYVRS